MHKLWLRSVLQTGPAELLWSFAAAHLIDLQGVDFNNEPALREAIHRARPYLGVMDERSPARSRSRPPDRNPGRSRVPTVVRSPPKV